MILSVSFNFQETKPSDRTMYTFLFFFCSCNRTENAIKNLWNSSLKNRAENCSTSYPDQCSSHANKERRSSSPEAKLEIDLLHKKQRNCGSPREVADRITDCSVEIASDRKGIAASASTCKRYSHGCFSNGSLRSIIFWEKKLMFLKGDCPPAGI